MSQIYLDRLALVRQQLGSQDIDALIVSLGHDMPYLTGYTPMPLERLTMLVVRNDRQGNGRATMIIPRLEAPLVTVPDGAFEMRPWGETEDPVQIAASLLEGSHTIAVGDEMWARFLVELIPLLPGVTYRRAVDVVSPMRIVKDAAEVDALAAAGAAVDRIAAELQAGRIPLVGRTEAEVSADLSARIVAEGHQKVNFAIVAAGENAASPHHHAGQRVIRENEIVLCDFGGTMNGYCSDITRCVFTGEPTSEVADAYSVLLAAQQAAVAAAVVGTACEDVDRVARDIITASGYGDFFVHRTGHGIGLQEHEDPYIVEGNQAPLKPGNAFSIEPGIYMPGRWGMRLEDIVVATEAGPRSLNTANHALVSVSA